MTRTLLAGLAVATVAPTGATQRPSSAEEAAVAGQAIVREFYQHLLSQAPPEKCPRVFDDPETFVSAIPPSEHVAGLDSNAQVWSYLRQRKELFLFAAIETPEQLNRLAFRFLVSDVDNWRRRPTVVVFHTLSIGGREGAFKQVAFPLEPGKKASAPYVINIAGLTVNGILLDPKREFDRSKDFYRLLGFR